MAKLIITIKPKQRLVDEVQMRAKALLNYTREIPDIQEDDTEKTEVLTSPAQWEGQLSQDIEVSAEINDYAPETEVKLSIISCQGIKLVGPEKFTPESKNETSFEVEWVIDKENIDYITTETIQSGPEEIKMLVRHGRFMPIGFYSPPYRNYSLLICTIKDEDLRTTELQKFFGTQSFRTTSRRLPKELLPELASLPLRSVVTVNVGIDGRFEFSIPVNGEESGWMWLLNGDETFLGLQKEGILDPIPGVMTILLPASETTGETIPPETSTENIAPMFAEGKCTSGTPIDVTETELLSNPELFSDDPGTFCKPFSNPFRIVNERSFHTILRVEQPEVGGEPSVPPDKEIPPLTISPIFGEALGIIPGLLNLPEPSSGTHPQALRAVYAPAYGLAESAKVASIAPAITTKAAIAGRRRWTLVKSTGRYVLDRNNPLDWEGDSFPYQATSLGFGHILEHRVRWRSNGWSLGNVAHTLTLAPRQTKRIVTVASRILDRARRVEETEVAERVAQGTDRSYSYLDAVKSSLNEWARGSSSSSTTGVAGGAGFAFFGFVIGGGASYGTSESESSQAGGRNVAAQEEQALRDSIRQYGESLRQLESLVVLEQSQEEFVQGISEVVRNPNYCHSLTVIYHEILRHLRVDTEIVGARECVFVPFALKPFTKERVLRWRDTLERGLRKRELRWVMRYLQDIENDFQYKPMLKDPRSEHPIRHITGSLYIRLAIERPRDDEEGKLVEPHWICIGPLLHYPIYEIYARLQEQNDRQRDAVFQKDYAPNIAAKWVDSLVIEELDGADFTLATSYGFNRTVRVDFTYHPSGDGKKRKDLTQLTVKVKEGTSLPPKSIANLIKAEFQYVTDHFERRVVSPSVVDDLIDVANGNPTKDGAKPFFNLSSWETINMKEEILKAKDELLEHLTEHLEYYHKYIWWYGMDRDKIYMMLDSLRLSMGDGRSVASVVERDPIGILGNSLVFRVATGAHIGVGGHESTAALNNYYRDSSVRSEPMRVSLPTNGLYAQTIMDECGACEEHFGSTDWVLSDNEPELEELGVEALRSRRATLPEVTPSQFPSSIINLQNAPNVPPPSGLADVLNAVQNSGAFRDMAGLAGTQANARAAMETAASLAQGFGQMAIDFQKSKQATADAKHKISNIKKALDDGLIDETEAKRQTAKLLSEQNMTPPSPSLTEDLPLTESLYRAGQSGQPIEVTRQTPRGMETVKIGRQLGDITLASVTEEPPAQAQKKLPSRAGNQDPQAWENLAPIAPRTQGGCPGGTKNLGTILFIHDAEKKIDFEDYGGYTNADAWMKIHTVSDLINGLRAYVGNCNYVAGIHINAHGGFLGNGGFRLGDEDDGDGRVEPDEANDMVSTRAQTTRFGQLIRNALNPSGDAFISVSACGSAGNNNDFILTLHMATSVITIGTPRVCRTGGNWWHKAWWETVGGRIQVNADGTIRVDARQEGTGIWKPF